MQGTSRLSTFTLKNAQEGVSEGGRGGRGGSGGGGGGGGGGGVGEETSRSESERRRLSFSLSWLVITPSCRQLPSISSLFAGLLGSARTSCPSSPRLLSAAGSKVEVGKIMERIRGREERGTGKRNGSLHLNPPNNDTAATRWDRGHFKTEM
jgi:hypothetical protein